MIHITTVNEKNPEPQFCFTGLYCHTLRTHKGNLLPITREHKKIISLWIAAIEGLENSTEVGAAHGGSPYKVDLEVAIIIGQQEGFPHKILSTLRKAQVRNM